jgi:2,5-furandicarboxylate decarboxylase 1
MRRLALALDCKPDQLSARYTEACERPIPPATVAQAPVHANVRRGPDVDLGLLPPMVYHVNDAERPYITAAIVAARDPDTGRNNLSYHRLMILGSNRTAIYMADYKHLSQIHAKYRDLDRAMPIAAFLGVHPTCSLGAVYTGEEDEYAIIGGLRGSPLEVVSCLSQPDLVVPAHAEIVLEGTVSQDERTEEGPFGEFTGYSTGTLHTPVFDVEIMSHRDDPLFQDIVSGQTEHSILPMLGIEAHLLATARRICPGVRAVRLPAPLTLLISLQKTSDEEPRRLIEALLRADIYAKNAIVLDASVNLGDLGQVFAALAMHTQADRDLVILTDQPGTPLDPSCESEDGRTTKMGIDATRPLSSRRPISANSVPAEILERIDLSEFF